MYLGARFYYSPDEGGGAAVAEEPEVVETPEEPVGQEPTPAPEAPDYTELFSTMEAFGLGKDPASVAAQLRQMRAHADEAQQLRAFLWQQRQQAQQPQQKAAEPEKPKLPWDIPKFDRRALSLLSRDDNGNLVAAPGADMTLPDQYRKWNEARDAALDQFLNDPYGALQGGLMPLVQQEAQRVVQQIISQQQAQYQQQNVSQRLEKFIAENKSWAYDQITGQLSPAGKIWDNAFRAAVQYGHPDPFDAAERYLDAELFRMEQQQPAKPDKPKPGTERLAFLKGKQGANRGASLNRPNGKKSPAQDPDAIFEGLKKQFQDLHAENPAAFLED